MKKVITFIFAVCMVFTFAACGNKEEVKKVGGVIVDNEKVKMTVKGMETRESEVHNASVEKKHKIYELSIEIENKTAGKVTYMLKSAAINNVQVIPDMPQYDIPAGKVKPVTMKFNMQEVSDYDIKEPTDFGMLIVAKDEKDPDCLNPVFKDYVHYYPSGEAAKKLFEYKANGKDDVEIFDNNNLSAVATNFRFDEHYGFIADFIVTNKTDKELFINWQNFALNDKPNQPNISSCMTPNAISIWPAKWSDASIKNFALKTIDKITFDISAVDMNDKSNNAMIFQEKGLTVPVPAVNIP